MAPSKKCLFYPEIIQDGPFFFSPHIGTSGMADHVLGVKVEETPFLYQHSLLFFLDEI